MKVVERFNVSKPPDGPRTFTFQLSGAGLVSVLVVGTLCLIWVFILGVLVGRGYKPEAAVPELAQMMPSAPPQAQTEQKEPPTVLKPEELQFMDNLQGKKPPAETVTVDSAKKTGDKAGAPESGQTPPTSSLEKTPAPLPKGQVSTAPAQPDRKMVSSSDPKAKAQAPTKDQGKAPAAKDAKTSKDQPKDTKAKPVKEQPKDAKAKDQAGKRFFAVYQIASNEDKKQSESEAGRLSKKGLNAHVEEATVDGKTVYRVILRVRGSDAEIKSALDQAGAKKPIQREKKPL